MVLAASTGQWIDGRRLAKLKGYIKTGVVGWARKMKPGETEAEYAEYTASRCRAMWDDLDRKLRRDGQLLAESAIMRKLKIDQPEIVKVEPRVRPSMLSRLVCLSPLDWKLFATALEDAFPNALYSRHRSIEESKRAERPEIQLERKLCLPDPSGPAGIAAIGPNQMHFGPATELFWKNDFGWDVTIEGLYWPQLVVGRPVPPYPADAHGPEYIREGQIRIDIAPHHKGHARFTRQIYRLLAQFTTNQRQILVRYPHYEVVPEPPGPPLFGLWIGHDALRWAREDPKRLLAYERSPMSKRTPDYLGYGYRPVS